MNTHAMARLVGLVISLLTIIPRSSECQPTSQSTTFPTPSGRMTLTSGRSYGLSIRLGSVDDSNLGAVRIPITNEARSFWDVRASDVDLPRIPAATYEVPSPVDAAINLITTGSPTNNSPASSTIVVDVRTGDVSISFFGLGNPLLGSPSTADTSRCNSVAVEQIAYFIFQRMVMPALGQIIDQQNVRALPRIVSRMKDRFVTELFQIAADWRAGREPDAAAGVGALCRAVFDDDAFRNAVFREFGLSQARRRAARLALSIADWGVIAANLSGDLTYFRLRSQFTPCPVLVTAHREGSTLTCPVSSTLISHAPTRQINGRAVRWVGQVSVDDASNCRSAVSLHDDQLYPAIVLYAGRDQNLYSVDNDGHIAALCWHDNWLVAVGGRNDPDHPTVLFIDTTTHRTFSQTEPPWSAAGRPWSDFWNTVTCEATSVAVSDTDYQRSASYPYPSVSQTTATGATLRVENRWRVTQYVFVDGTYVGSVPSGTSHDFQIQPGSRVAVAADSRDGTMNPVSDRFDITDGMIEVMTVGPSPISF